VREVRSLARGALDSVAARPAARRIVESPGVSREMLRHYVAGDEPDAALAVCWELHATGRLASIARLISDPVDTAEVLERAEAYRSILTDLHVMGLAQDAEVTFTLDELGRYDVDPDLALEQLRDIVVTARGLDARVMVETLDAERVDDVLDVVAALREVDPRIGVALRAAFPRTEQDCRDLAGTRVRLSKGATTLRAGAGAYTRWEGVDRNFARCLKILLSGEGEHVIATNDQRLLRITDSVAAHLGRARGSFEYQLRYGVRPMTQAIIADRGDRMRVYVPYGPEWYEYLIDRFGEQPRLLGSMVRAAIGH
jgi:proline dehydrogenase